jgi:hypothetical protein
LEHLKGALTTFPAARKLALDTPFYRYEDTDVETLVQWLLEGGRGRRLERLTKTHEGDDGSHDLAHRALQAGALPSLKELGASLDNEVHRASMKMGFIRGLHELRVQIRGYDPEVKPQVAALGLLRQLPSLAKLDVYMYIVDAVECPPFIPPSLKALRLESAWATYEGMNAIMRLLPGMLRATGATLDHLEVIPTPDY